MASAGLQMIGTALAIIGWMMVIVVCALPMWKVTAFIGHNIVTAQTTWVGIWMNCVVQSTGQMQCKVYDSMLALSADMQAARAMIIVAILAGICGIMVSVAGGKCTNCIEDARSKSMACITAGILFIIAGLLCLIPVSWSAHSIIADFYNPLMMDAQRRELFKMGRIGKEVSGQVLCFLGLIGICLTCGLPLWRVTTFIGANIVSGQIVWDGLWMNCVIQSTGQMQCKIQSSLMNMTQDLQVAQALTVIAILIAFAGVLLTFIGGRCTSCLKNESSMAKTVICGGVLCIVAAIVCLIPVCWSAAFTVSDYKNVLTPTAQKREIGACVYIGWGTTCVLLLGGILLCTSCPPNDSVYRNNMGMYPYQGPVMGPAGPYMPAKGYRPSVTYSGTYVPNKQYAAPRAYSAVPGQYL
ncbi:claudin f [Trichomycterus rosablanca]|uniref:claudin f n=1 Tax=Trichomycterus rosablanca TaxID=2290929 RepID=UPI002F35C33B